jgi:hypothetical protein
MKRPACDPGYGNVLVGQGCGAATDERNCGMITCQGKPKNPENTWVQISARRPAILSYDFSQSLQANASIVP